MLSIRPAVPTDAETILRFVHELADYERAPEAVVATIDDVREALFGQSPAAEAVIADVNGLPAGMGLFFENFSTWTGRRGLYLEDLYVTPASRRLGVGTALLAYLARIAVDRGCGRFEWAVLDWNVSAIQFYLSKGAEAMNDWRTYRVSGQALTELAGL